MIPVAHRYAVPNISVCPKNGCAAALGRTECSPIRDRRIPKAAMYRVNCPADRVALARIILSPLVSCRRNSSPPSRSSRFGMANLPLQEARRRLVISVERAAALGRPLNTVRSCTLESFQGRGGRTSRSGRRRPRCCHWQSQWSLKRPSCNSGRGFGCCSGRTKSSHG